MHVPSIGIGRLAVPTTITKSLCLSLQTLAEVSYCIDEICPVLAGEKQAHPMCCRCCCQISAVRFVCQLRVVSCVFHADGLNGRV